MPQGLLCQFMGTKYAIQAVRDQFGDDLHPGDVILTNDPYKGMTVHLPDWGFIRPIFFEGELLFFTLVRGHQMDTGGSFPGGYFPNSFDIHAEGLCIPPTKVFENDKERSDVMRLIWNNVRWPEAVRVDNYAMVATTRFAEKRVHDVLKRYGKDTVMECIREMLDRTERAVRSEIAAIPDGTYYGEAATDDDGTVLDQPVWVRVKITVKGDSITVDFSGSDAQRKGFVNCPFAASYAIAVGSMMLLFDPALADYHNEGSLRPITVITPPGSVVHPLYPATVGAAPVNVGHQIATAVHAALSKARPNRAMAAWGKRRGDYVSVVDPRSGQPYVRTTFDYDGSAGAVTGHDGPTGPLSIGSLATVMRSNAEEMEIRFPWRLLKWEAATDLMGAGRWRGGGGIDWRAMNEGSDGRMATGSSDGDMTPGRGRAGRLPIAVLAHLHGARRQADPGQAAPHGRDQERRRGGQDQRRRRRRGPAHRSPARTGRAGREERDGFGGSRAQDLRRGGRSGHLRRGRGRNETPALPAAEPVGRQPSTRRSSLSKSCPPRRG